MADEPKNKSVGADGFMPWFKETFPYGLAGQDSPLSFLRAKSDEEKKPGMKRGGAVAAVHKHERAMHKGKPLTKLAKGGSASSRADGCATKGKTKGRFV